MLLSVSSCILITRLSCSSLPIDQLQCSHVKPDLSATNFFFLMRIGSTTNIYFIEISAIQAFQTIQNIISPHNMSDSEGSIIGSGAGSLASQDDLEDVGSIASGSGSSSRSASPEIEEDEAPATFESLGIIPQLVSSCETLGFKKPTGIQAQSIPHALAGKDIIGLAQTGSGKTAAFALPILQKLWSNPQPFFGLVLAPTRELAYQISEQFTGLGSPLGVRTAVIVGGMDMMSQSLALGKRPHIVVATPGRLMDHLENTKGFSLRNIKYLVSPNFPSWPFLLPNRLLFAPLPLYPSLR